MKIRFRTIIITALSALFMVPFLYFSFVYYESYEIIKNLPIYQPNLPTKLFDENGELISELYDEHRAVVSIKELPSYVYEAFVVMEDRNFYRHFGFDVLSIARALIIDLLAGEFRQGGSTITQQLVKRLYTEGEKTFRRKIIELLIAREFERRYTKLEILEMYLNLIYFGHGAYGINSAAHFFFGCEAKNLTAMQACVLASLTTAPNRHSPIRNPEAAYDRSRQVLMKLVAAGIVSREEAARQFESFWTAYLEELRDRYPTLTVRHRTDDRAPYFTEYVRRELVKKFGADKVYRGGLKVYTTLDLRCQHAAREVMAAGLSRQDKISSAYNRSVFNHFEKNYAKKYLALNRGSKKELSALVSLYRTFKDEIIDELMLFSDIFSESEVSEVVKGFNEEYEWFRSSGKTEGALVAIDPFTGAIIAMVGGSGFTPANQLNRAVQARRQPGSAFKIFVWGAGIAERIITAATPFFDISTEDMEPYIEWHPRNYDKKNRGLVLARKALALSLNIVSVQIYEKVGGERIWKFASRLMNLPKSRFQIDPTLAMGTSELTPLELTAGVSAFANGGYSITPFAIQKIIDKDGRVLYDRSQEAPESKRVMSAEAAFIMTELLKEVVNNGTAAYAVRRVAGLRTPAAGKTGTNTAFRDAWFTGFTPFCAGTVWVGCDVPRFSLGYHQSGAAVAAPLWGEFMRRVSSFRKWRSFPRKGEGVQMERVCSKTGLLPAAGCPIIEEYFIRGTEPKETCSGTHDSEETI